MAEELLAIESEIDGLALMSFDQYSACREKLYSIRVYEIKSQVRKILEVMEWKSAKEEAQSGPDDNKGESVT